MKTLIALMLIVAMPVIAIQKVPSDFVDATDTNLTVIPANTNLKAVIDFIDDNFISTSNLAEAITNTALTNVVLDIIDGGTTGTVGTITRTNGNEFLITFPLTTPAPIEPQAESYISEAWVQFFDATTIVVTNGEGYNNGKYWSITQAITHTMTSLAVGEDFHYIYIDDDASIFPNGIVIIDSTNEPTDNVLLKGRYNGDDRIVGFVRSTNGVAEVEPFLNYGGDFIYSEKIQLGNDMDPNGLWQQPNVFNSSEKLPINAKAALIRAEGDDDAAALSALVAISIAEFTNAVNGEVGVVYVATGKERTDLHNWINLGESREVVVRGDDSDLNTMDLELNGVRIYR